MILVKINSGGKLLDKLTVILDDAMARKDNHIVLLVESTSRDFIELALNSHKKVGRVMTRGKSLYCIKEMRIELQTIDYTI